jgi:hypothetical protein
MLRGSGGQRQNFHIQHIFDPVYYLEHTRLCPVFLINLYGILKYQQLFKFLCRGTDGKKRNIFALSRFLYFPHGIEGVKCR